eukprot:616419_1
MGVLSKIMTVFPNRLINRPNSSQLLKTSECDHVQSQPSSEYLSGHTNSAFSTVVQPTAENSSQNSKSPETSQSKPIETSAIPNGTLSTEQSSGAGTSNS